MKRSTGCGSLPAGRSGCAAGDRGAPNRRAGRGLRPNRAGVDPGAQRGNLGGRQRLAGSRHDGAALPGDFSISRLAPLLPGTIAGPLAPPPSSRRAAGERQARGGLCAAMAGGASRGQNGMDLGGEVHRLSQARPGEEGCRADDAGQDACVWSAGPRINNYIAMPGSTLSMIFRCAVVGRKYRNCFQSGFTNSATQREGTKKVLGFHPDYVSVYVPLESFASIAVWTIRVMRCFYLKRKSVPAVVRLCSSS
jgi:hypothetical protein